MEYFNKLKNLCKVDASVETYRMIRNKFVQFNGSRLHYAKTGEGDHAMLIFHGFGQDLGTFESFTRSLSKHYTFYVFDLYFHGQSEWAHGEQTLTKKEWKQTIAVFLKENQVEKFSLAGFSLGGKFVLATLESFPEKIKRIFLIAPDGIKTSFWYSLATYPIAFRLFFKSMILHPSGFLKIAELLNRSGIIDKGLIRFAEYQMNSTEKRNRVYYSWVVFRHLHFQQHRIVELLNKNGIHVTLIVGLYDKVIEPKNMDSFVRKLRHVKLEVLESGHTGLINQSLPFFTAE